MADHDFEATEAELQRTKTALEQSDDRFERLIEMFGGADVVHQLEQYEAEVTKLKEKVATLEDERATTMNRYLSQLNVPDDLG
jgi:polyhydroxyalkanoate synthesis regulator phasin